MNFKTIIKITLFLVLTCFKMEIVLSQNELPLNKEVLQKIDEEIYSLMEEGDIPGLSLAIVDGDKEIIKTYGFADLETSRKVNENTLFQIGSCSKAFTALAMIDLIKEYKLDVNSPVSDYLPWFKVNYKKKEYKITIQQLLNHTSGIPWSTISKIPESENSDALIRTVETLIGQELSHIPGKEYEYATINYDVLALIIQQVSGTTFEDYLTKKVINKLGLKSTSIGTPLDTTRMAKGYKIGFFQPLDYTAPIYKGNAAAGYVISDIKDMTKWLKFNMGHYPDYDLYSKVKLAHERDETVPLHNMSSYAMGWEVLLDGTGEISHGGYNPNFTAQVGFLQEDNKGVVILANSNSNYTFLIANNILKILRGKKVKKSFYVDDNNDKNFSIISLSLVLYSFISFLFLGLIGWEVFKGKRSVQKLRTQELKKIIFPIIGLLPFAYGLYIFPKALANFEWEAILVWMPISFEVMIKLIIFCVAITYLIHFISVFFVNKNEYIRIAPKVVLVSIFSGFANMVLIIMVTSLIGSDIKLKYIIFYYALLLGVYLLGRRFVQINLIKFSRKIVYNFIVQIINKVFSTSYENFEKMDRGRIYTVLNQDVNQIGRFAGTFLQLTTSIITVLGAFIYLSIIAFWAAVITIGLIILLSFIYFKVSVKTEVHYEDARSEKNVYMRLINSMVDGFKELNLHSNKKKQFQKDVNTSADIYREKQSIADVNFVNAFILGESLLVILLGVIAFGMPEIFPKIPLHVITSFVIILLYLIGPINDILNSVPRIVEFKVAWRRVKKFLGEIPETVQLEKTKPIKVQKIQSFKVENIEYEYEKRSDERNFKIGPINLEIEQGEIVFIIGGNGSGKTTLAKLLTGLYGSKSGAFFINNKKIDSCNLGEYFSAVFSPVHLFEKLYNIDLKAKEKESQYYLEVLQLDQKVKLIDNSYSTIKLSAGQRKRLALLQCYLEDSPIYLFDEWAADQDPNYRKFFYKTLLPKMKEAGKIVIAITHDDNYFDIADKVLKMDQGQLKSIVSDYVI